MASWFSGAAVLSEGLGDKLNGLKDTVQAKVKDNINIDPELIKKLTLQSDELVSERERIIEEDTRKEHVRDSLADILPWETRDAEMEILVDECKEVILGLSSKGDTFTGPFVLAGGLPGFGEDEEEEQDADGGEEGGDGEERKAEKDLAAAEVSAEKLSKLQPLPTLLADFDLDTHVGLIQRLLGVDPNLVEVHSRLSSGGQRELIFWKNYFFHCAYTRYEAGLSIDEIWSNEPRPASSAASTAETEDYAVVDEDQDDEEVIFDSSSTSGTSVESGSNKVAETILEGGSGAVGDATSTTQTSAPAVGSISPPASPQRESNYVSDPVTPSDSAIESGGGVDYEFVASAGGDEDDGEMDELEAEIAAAMAD